MTLGTAIFLSSLVFALVILYGITKDRWRWRTIVKRTALTIVAIVALGGAVVGVLYVWNLRPVTHDRQTEYAGLRLGISPDEVMYIKGKPFSVLREATGGSFDNSPIVTFDDTPTTYIEKKGERVQDYREWLYYEIGSGSLKVTFNPEKTTLMAIKCFSEERYACPSILGISSGYSEQEVVQKLGAPGKSRIEGLNKYMSYPELGVHFDLTNAKGVYKISVAAPNHWRD